MARLLNSRRWRRGRACRGAVLVEFALMLPLLLLMTAAMIDVGSYFFQLQLVADGARYGARHAVLLAKSSEYLSDCAVLKTEANAATTQYITNTLKIPQQQWELANGGAKICAAMNGDLSRAYTVISQQVTIKETILRTCLFCFAGNYLSIRPSVRMSFLLQSECVYILPDSSLEYPDAC